MTGVVFLLIVNVAVTGFFAAAFAAVALIGPGQRRAFWFAGAYGVGMLTPLSEFLLPLSPIPEPFAFISYASFLGGPLLIPIGLAAVHDAPRPWRAFWIILGGGIGLRLVIWHWDRGSLPYELAYQLPFALGAMLASRTILRLPERRPLHIAVAMLFALIALQFLAKPFLAMAFGSGSTAATYVRSTYAIISQASTAVLLVAAGLLLLLIVVQKAIGDSQAASETDTLSGLANRRGFDRQGQRLIARAARDRLPLSAILFDLDHFKGINDTYGHAMGDAVIASFGDLLRRSAPQSAVVGRIGGEEYAVLLQETVGQMAWLKAEAIRVALPATADAGLPRVTVSGGVAEWEPGESLADLMRRADRACYDAKGAGRNRVHSADAGSVAALSVLPHNRAASAI
ncbi:GGDEF domain-containing protein [Sphingomonas sp. dw_22]|uniref:GGDEF domain-containing protein n=1 Tax=Sphingomonas sp. dw_22 TaxID=2721175 RepID=UPI001BD2969A|nr:GGDEF domain-containing protein [Sphingomonas sp. dw_22]